MCVGQRINFRNWFSPSTVGSGNGTRVVSLARQKLLLPEPSHWAQEFTQFWQLAGPPCRTDWSWDSDSVRTTRWPDCLILRTSFLCLNLNCISVPTHRTPLFSSPCDLLGKNSLCFYYCLFNWSARDWWVWLVYWDCQSSDGTLKLQQPWGRPVSAPWGLSVTWGGCHSLFLRWGKRWPSS